MNNFMDKLGDIFKIGMPILILIAFAGFLKFIFCKLWALPDKNRPQKISFLHYIRSFFANISFPLIICFFSFLSNSLLKIENKNIYQAWLIIWITVLFLDIIENILLEITISVKGFCKIPRVMRGLIKVMVLVFVAIFIAKYLFNLNPTALLTSTAILTGLAGLAMQGIFGNLFSGISINISGILGIGDYVKIGEFEGYVHQINWRETRLLTTTNNIIVIPNSNISKCELINYSKPDLNSRLEIVVSVSYNHAPHEVLPLLYEAAKECSFILERPKPTAFITGYLDFCVEYKLRFFVDDYTEYPIYKGEVNRLIWYKFKRNGIEIPFPMSGRLLQNFLDGVAKLENKIGEVMPNFDNVFDEVCASDFIKKLASNDADAEILKEQIKPFLANFKRELYTKNEYIFVQNRKDDEALYILVKGKLCGEIDGVDGKRINFEINSGAVIGEMSLLTGASRSASIRVLEESILIKISPKTFALISQKIPSIMDTLSQLIIERNSENTAKFEQENNKSIQRVKQSLFNRFWDILSK